MDKLAEKSRNTQIFFKVVFGLKCAGGPEGKKREPSSGGFGVIQGMLLCVVYYSITIHNIHHPSLTSIPSSNQVRMKEDADVTTRGKPIEIAALARGAGRTGYWLLVGVLHYWHFLVENVSGPAELTGRGGHFHFSGG